MITARTAARALESDSDAIAFAVADALDRGDIVTDDNGVIGITYYDCGTRMYYAADLDDCRKLLTRIAACEPDAYSLWCASTSATEHRTPEGAAAVM